MSNCEKIASLLGEALGKMNKETTLNDNEQMKLNYILLSTLFNSFDCKGDKVVIPDLEAIKESLDATPLFKD